MGWSDSHGDCHSPALAPAPGDSRGDCRSAAALGAQAPGAFGGTDGVPVLVVEAGIEEGAPVVYAAPHGGQVGEVVGREAEMGPGARPGPGFRPLDEAAPHRVQLDVAKAGVKMRLVHRDRSEATLPEMSAPAPAAVDLDGIAGVRRRQGRPQAVFMRRHQDEVDVVGHEAPRPDGRAALPAEVTEQVEVEKMVVVAEEDAPAAVAALSGVVGQSRQDLAGGARHPWQANRKAQFIPVLNAKMNE